MFIPLDEPVEVVMFERSEEGAGWRRTGRRDSARDRRTSVGVKPVFLGVFRAAEHGRRGVQLARLELNRLYRRVLEGEFRGTRRRQRGEKYKQWITRARETGKREEKQKKEKERNQKKERLAGAVHERCRGKKKMMPEVAQANRSGADGQFFNEDYIPKLSMILVILQWDYILC